MKSLVVSGILLAVMAAYLIIPVIPVIDYLINKDYIAKNLCINKDKPKSCCKGKCHMVKQLQKTNQNTEKDPKNTNNRVQLKDMNEFILGKSGSFTLLTVRNTYLLYNILSSDQLACSAIFVPPKHYSSLFGKMNFQNQVSANSSVAFYNLVDQGKLCQSKSDAKEFSIKPALNLTC